jgi:predicted RNA polymerase sigma factor
LAVGWETLLTALGQTAFALEFQDDAHFFRGELARQRGDLAEATVQYQRCIDVSRDPWPANWSRFRLAQLAANPARTKEAAP